MKESKFIGILVVPTLVVGLWAVQAFAEVRLGGVSGDITYHSPVSVEMDQRNYDALIQKMRKLDAKHAEELSEQGRHKNLIDRHFKERYALGQEIEEAGKKLEESYKTQRAYLKSVDEARWQEENQRHLEKYGEPKPIIEKYKMIKQRLLDEKARLKQKHWKQRMKRGSSADLVSLQQYPEQDYIDKELAAVMAQIDEEKARMAKEEAVRQEKEAEKRPAPQIPPPPAPASENFNGGIHF